MRHGIMIKDLLDRTITKQPTTLNFEGRILYLLDDTELVNAQLYEGTDIEFTAELKGRLRDQISTDEITPAYICFFYDETLAEITAKYKLVGGPNSARRIIRSILAKLKKQGFSL